MSNLNKTLLVGIIVVIIFLSFFVITMSAYLIQKNIETILEITQEEIQDIKGSVILLEEVKPSYDYLKSITVYIIGCADQEIDDGEEKFKRFYPIEKNGICWAGTGSIIKITEDFTYILTNNHVSGENTVNPVIYIENENQKVKAELVQRSTSADMSVIRVPIQLDGKREVKGYTTANIQDKVYIVGHALGDPYIYTEGVFAGYSENDALFQAPCIYGNSGSAIVDKNGYVVALVWGLQGYPGFLGIPNARITHTLAVDGLEIQSFLKGLNLI